MEQAVQGTCGDGLFGPVLNLICCGGFDFTSLFEESILGLLPAACFILLVPLRIWQLATRKIVAAFGEGGAPVLKEINLTISPGQKIAICGRTENGNSSFLMSLLRAVHADNGSLVVESHDISRLLPSRLRKRINCMTQEPFVFSSTVRRNVDPDSIHSDEAVSSALTTVGLWDVLTIKAQSTGQDPLALEMDENVLSYGQQQLLSLARAQLRKCRVLVLDEPTSMLENETQAQVQAVIQSLFCNCTVLMVAHRFMNIVSFDRVVALDRGEIVKDGSPRQVVGGWWERLEKICFIVVVAWERSNVTVALSLR